MTDMTKKNQPSKTTKSAPPLWKVLQHSANVLQKIESGQSWAVVSASVESGLRPAVQAVVYAVLRNWWLGQALQQALLVSSKKMPKRAVVLLRATVVLLAAERYLDGAVYDTHTVVNQAVEAAKRSPKMRHVAGVVNACLRRLLREREALLTQVMADDSVRFNLPAWWLGRLQVDYPRHWQQVVDWQRQPARLALRVNTARVSMAAYIQELDEMGIGAEWVGDTSVILQKSSAVEQLPGYAKGWFAVQDVAAQLAAPLLLDAVFGLSSGAKHGAEPFRVLDACAAPGGKTAHLLAYAEQCGKSIEVLALEVDAKRSERIAENLTRLGHKAKVVVADAADTASWYVQWSERIETKGMAFFDAVLLDAPCTAAGVVRRHPDIALLRRAEDVLALAEQQKRLLNALWPFVKADGCLLYCTCSLFKEEGDLQIKAFLENNSNARLLPSPGHLLSVNPSASGQEVLGLAHNVEREHDAFYYALLRKSAACSFG